MDVSAVEAVVIGGSAGAFSALKVLLPRLPPTLRVPVIVVVHLPPDRPSAIAEVFSHGQLRVKEADDKEPLEPATVYFAPPGYHLLVEADRSLALAADEPVHFSRPSIDVLFESAADAFGDRLLAVVLSGASEDGAAGLETVRRRGGLTIVQDPATAEQAVMPNAAIAAGEPAAIVPIEDMTQLLAGLGAGQPHPEVDPGEERYA
jgi:two-component system chemotaxis response regulator CheB